MASTQIIKPFHTGAAEKAEMRVSITSTASGAEYEFTLKRKHIEVVQTKGKKSDKPHGKDEPADWFTGLNEEEKTQVFALIMDQYRDRSLGDNGFRGAAIGVVPERVGGQSRIFIGTNTTRWASPYFKDCAEQNMVNAATDTLAFEAVKDGKQPHPAKLKSIYIMQGVNEDVVPMACACGKCTDMLARVMENSESPVITVPLLTDALRKKFDSKVNHKDLVVVNEKAASIGGIKPPKEQKILEVWKKPIAFLNVDRELDLSPEIAKEQKLALNRVVKEAASEFGLPEDAATKSRLATKEWLKKHVPIEPEPKTAIEMVDALIHTVKTRVSKITNQMREIVASLGEPAEKAAENVLLQRHSEAELDCAVRPDKTVDLGRMNDFLVEQIRYAVADRLHAKEKSKAHSMTTTDSQNWVKENIKYIRCVAIQLDDGTFRYAVQAEGKLDNAMPNAEVVALENAVTSLGRYGVRHVWAMEMNVDDIANGKMHTSPKEGVERLVKRASVEGLDFHYIPFNAGGKTHDEAMSGMVTRSRNEIYPAGHSGYLAATSNKAVKARPAPEAWADFARSGEQAHTAARA